MSMLRNCKSVGHGFKGQILQMEIFEVPIQRISPSFLVGSNLSFTWFSWELWVNFAWHRTALDSSIASLDLPLLQGTFLQVHLVLPQEIMADWTQRRCNKIKRQQNQACQTVNQQTTCRIDILLRFQSNRFKGRLWSFFEGTPGDCLGGWIVRQGKSTKLRVYKHGISGIGILRCFGTGSIFSTPVENSFCPKKAEKIWGYTELPDTSLSWTGSQIHFGKHWKNI